MCRGGGLVWRCDEARGDDAATDDGGVGSSSTRGGSGEDGGVAEVVVAAAGSVAMRDEFMTFSSARRHSGFTLAIMSSSSLDELMSMSVGHGFILESLAALFTRERCCCIWQSESLLVCATCTNGCVTAEDPFFLLSA
jgi:hypothetical protein